MIASWGNYFHQVSWGLDKNFWFFINGQFLSVFGFFLLRPYLSKFLKFLSDFTTIQDFGLNRKILRARFCGSVHSYALSCHFDCRIIASRCGHFYLSFHHFCRESRSCFHSTNFHSCSMGRRYSTSGKYLHIN